METLLSPRLRALRAMAQGVSSGRIEPHAEEVDRECAWPRHSMDALAEAGLMWGRHCRSAAGGGQMCVTVTPE